MPNVEQPAVPIDKGMILSIGIIANADRMQIVMPMLSDASTIFAAGIQASDLCKTAETLLIPLLQACMSSDASITFLSAEGMADGIIPARFDYGIATYPGTLDAGALPDNVGGMMVWYEDPRDAIADARARSCRNTVPGVPKSEYIGGAVSNVVQAALLAAATALQNGLESYTDAPQCWYRALSRLPRDSSATILRTWNATARGYVGTQRRRLVPH